MNIAVIGGGAAGFFAAISCKHHHPEASVTILEKTSKLLSKVRISGGGRCNVTHNCSNINQLSKHYPRGERFLKKAFHQFGMQDTVEWFTVRGVELKVEEDGRMFPVTDSSETIIECLMSEVERIGITIKTKSAVSNIHRDENEFALLVNNVQQFYDKVVVTIGGSSKSSGYDLLSDTGHDIESPIPSLFTFNMPDEPIRELMGLTVHQAAVKVQGTKLKYLGPLLITHWGMSGPAILKTSAWGAKHLFDLDYNFRVQINWLGEVGEAWVRNEISSYQRGHSKKKLINHRFSELPKRLWLFLLKKLEFREDLTWGELGNKGINRIINTLINDIYEVEGKTTFKEEFVTCGGVKLSDVNAATMQSKKMEGLYFAGEVLDIDGITGGFNFQSAWTTGYIAGKLN